MTSSRSSPASRCVRLSRRLSRQAPPRIAVVVFDEAADGVAGLELARRRRPDLVILDVMLPGTGGLAILEALRADPALAAIPVVVVTAWPQMEDEALEAGASRFFMKPFEPDAMKTAVEELLDR